MEENGRFIVTSVRVDQKSHEWIRSHDTTYRAVVHAGIIRLKEGELLSAKDREILELRSNLSSAVRHKEMVWYIFKKYPEIYQEARVAIDKDEKESA